MNEISMHRNVSLKRNVLRAVFIFLIVLASFSSKKNLQFDHHNCHYFFSLKKGCLLTPTGLSSEIITSYEEYFTFTESIMAYCITLKLKFKDFHYSLYSKIKASVSIYTSRLTCHGGLCYKSMNKQIENILWITMPSKQCVTNKKYWSSV